MQTQSYAEIFDDIAETLTLENWRKCVYFKEDQGQLCMCAHGALQARVNPEVKKALTITTDVLASRAPAPAPAVEEAAMAGAGAQMLAVSIENNFAASSSEIWNLRSSSSRSDYIYNGKNYGKREAHYLLGIVGLTVAFNDAKDTTLEMVKEKFREASKLATQLGV